MPASLVASSVGVSAVCGALVAPRVVRDMARTPALWRGVWVGVVVALGVHLAHALVFGLWVLAGTWEVWGWVPSPDPSVGDVVGAGWGSFSGVLVVGLVALPVTLPVGMGAGQVLWLLRRRT